MSFDIDRGVQYFLAMRSSIARTYVERYGYSEEEAVRVANQIAYGLLRRNVGPENAEKVERELRRRGIWHQ